MAKRLRLARLIPCPSLLAVGCFAVEPPTGERSESVLEECRGSYECTLVPGGSTARASFSLSRREDGCYLGEVRVDVEGVIVSEEDRGFRLCAHDKKDNACIDCAPSETRSPEASARAPCAATSTNCPTVGAPGGNPSSYGIHGEAARDLPLP